MRARSTVAREHTHAMVAPSLPLDSSSPSLPAADEWNDVSSASAASLASRCMSAAAFGEGGRTQTSKAEGDTGEGGIEGGKEGGVVLWPFESPRPLSSSARALGSRLVWRDWHHFICVTCAGGLVTQSDVTVLYFLYVQSSTLFCANTYKKDPGRARQSSLATAGTNFTKPGAQNKGDLCTTHFSVLGTAISL